MNNLAVRLDIGSVTLLLASDFKEFQTRNGVKFEPSENRVHELIGKVEGQLLESVETVENEEATDSVDQFGRRKLAFVPKLPLDRTREVKRFVKEETRKKATNIVAQDWKHGTALRK